MRVQACVSLEERAEVCAHLDGGQLRACVAVHTWRKKGRCAHVKRWCVYTRVQVYLWKRKAGWVCAVSVFAHARE